MNVRGGYVFVSKKQPLILGNLVDYFIYTKGNLYTKFKENFVD